MLPADIEEIHRLACSRGEKSYNDPKTGYSVFTAVHLKAAGSCCGNGCRHCPFGHANVKDASRRTNLILEPVLLPASKPPRKPTGMIEQNPIPAIVCFFSGGKDSFIAVQWARNRALAAGEGKLRVVLLTTFDPHQGQHGTQKVPIQHIIDTTKRLGLDLIAVPVAGASKEYVESVEEGLGLIQSQGSGIDSLVFGDIELEDLRHWRDDTFKAYTIHYPIWKKTTNELLALLDEACAATGAAVTISAVDCAALEGQVVEGDVFDRAFVQRLPGGVHAFGENGEFHTKVSLS